MNLRIALGFLLSFGIGALCRVADLPLPSPPALLGAALVVAMTLGYLAVDTWASHRAATTRAHCGGPTGDTLRSTEPLP